MFAVFDDVITKQECEVLKSRIESWYFLNRSDDPKHLWDWKKRVLDATPINLRNVNCPFEQNFNLNEETKIVQNNVYEKIKKEIESKLNVKLTLSKSELQVWPINTNGPPHKHGEVNTITDFNSLLYLNDDFNGGEFFTETGIIVRPVPGRLTFFDGKNINHGVADIYDNNRYTMIFWWKDTKFK